VVGSLVPGTIAILQAGAHHREGAGTRDAGEVLDSSKGCPGSGHCRTEWLVLIFVP